MGSSKLSQWEMDPLFPAAEVVQDSADRMQSLFLHLSHEKTLSEDDSDPRLFSSIEHLKHELSTIIGTAKWQLEDFEREAKILPSQGKSRSTGDAISRRYQFITAIREHINNIESALADFSQSDPRASSKWGLDEGDGDVLASFLSGENSSEISCKMDNDSPHILRRFLDPVSTVSAESGGERNGAMMNGEIFNDYILKQRQNSFRNTGISTIDWKISEQNRLGEDDFLDLEANASATDKKVLKTLFLRISKLGKQISNLWIRSLSKKYAKKAKDGEENLQEEQNLCTISARFSLDSWRNAGAVGGVRIFLIFTVILLCLLLYFIWNRYT